MAPRAPVMTYALAASLVAVAYGVTGFFPTQETILPYAWGADDLQNSNWGALLTSLWVHGGALHLFGNLIALLSFGPLVERKLGHTPFLLLYLATGIAGNLAHVASGAPLPVVGASGAIFGILGALLILNPLASIALLGLLPMPILLASALYVAAVPFLNDLSTLMPVAHAAHLGGLAAGLGLAAGISPQRAWRILPLAALVFGTVWLAVGYATTLPLDQLLQADWNEATRLLWPLAAAALLILAALWGLGRIDARTEGRRPANEDL